jgi:predicted transcriptional regulator
MGKMRGLKMDYLSPIRSELKQKIILKLLEGEKKLAELRSGIDGRETSILHVLKEFENLNLTTKTKGAYSLTPLGIIEAQIFQDVVSTTEVIEKFKEFWLNHNIKPIPPQLISRLGALKESVLVHTEKTQLGQVYINFIQILMTSKKVSGISPIFHLDYVPIIENLLNQGNNVDLILTSEVLNKTLSAAHLDTLKKNFVEGTLKIFLNEDLRFALTVTDKNFSLGLFTTDGDYDDNMDLISTNPQAIQWGEELFQIKLKESMRIGAEVLS